MNEPAYERAIEYCRDHEDDDAAAILQSAAAIVTAAVDHYGDDCDTGSHDLNEAIRAHLKEYHDNA